MPFSAFFQEGIALSEGQDSSHFCCWWRQNFHKITIKNCKKLKNWQKSLCAPVRIDSKNILIKFHRNGLGPRT